MTSPNIVARGIHSSRLSRFLRHGAIVIFVRFAQVPNGVLRTVTMNEKVFVSRFDRGVVLVVIVELW